jgi:ketosteroid isomerase-like protein
MLRPTLAAFLLAAALAACGKGPSPEDEIRAVVLEAEQAAEARDAFALRALVADDYRDGRGNGAEDIRRFVHGYLLAHQSVHLLVKIEEIELPASDLARLRATVAMVGKEAEGASAWDLAADVYEFDVNLAREGGEWRVIRADWRPALGR